MAIIRVTMNVPGLNEAELRALVSAAAEGDITPENLTARDVIGLGWAGELDHIVARLAVDQITDEDVDGGRASRILAAIPKDGEDIQIVLMEVMDEGNVSTPLHRLIRESFSGDDDFDDLRHEIEHEMGECSDDNPECSWGDNPDEMI